MELMVLGMKYLRNMHMSYTYQPLHFNTANIVTKNVLV